jgi:hypothetical protein
MRVSTAVRNAMADGAVDLVDVGAGTATLEVYTGSAPATHGDAPAGTLLVSFNLPNPAFGAAATGVATLLGVPISDVGVGAGEAGFARVVNRNGDSLFETESVGTVGTTVIMSTTTVSVGLDVDLTAMTVTAPAGSV